MIDKLTSTEAIVWSPQTDDSGIQALSDLLATAKQEKNAE